MVLSIPVKLLGEAQGHVVSVELTDGVGYRGKLSQVEDSMNIQLEDVTVTQRDGAVSHLPQIYLRGSKVRFFSLPEILEHAPILEKV